MIQQHKIILAISAGIMAWSAIDLLSDSAPTRRSLRALLAADDPKSVPKFVHQEQLADYLKTVAPTIVHTRTPAASLDSDGNAVAVIDVLSIGSETRFDYVSNILT